MADRRRRLGGAGADARRPPFLAAAPARSRGRGRGRCACRRGPRPDAGRSRCPGVDRRRDRSRAQRCEAGVDAAARPTAICWSARPPVPGSSTRMGRSACSASTRRRAGRRTASTSPSPPIASSLRSTRRASCDGRSSGTGSAIRGGLRTRATGSPTGAAASSGSSGETVPTTRRSHAPLRSRRPGSRAPVAATFSLMPPPEARSGSSTPTRIAGSHPGPTSAAPWSSNGRPTAAASSS